MQRSKSCRRRRACSGRGRARVIPMFPRIMRDAGQWRVTHPGPAEFRRGGLPQDDRTLRLQPGNDRRVLARLIVLEDQAPVLRRHILRVRQVLDRHRHAMQRPHRAVLHQHRFRSPRRIHRLIRGQIGECIYLRLQCGDPLQQTAHHLHRRDLLGADHLRHLRCRRKSQVLAVHSHSLRFDAYTGAVIILCTASRNA